MIHTQSSLKKTLAEQCHNNKVEFVCNECDEHGDFPLPMTAYYDMENGILHLYCTHNPQKTDISILIHPGELMFTASEN